MKKNLSYWLVLVAMLFIITACDKNETAPTAVQPEGYLRAVRGSNPGIYDNDGRFVLLRGVNLNVLGDYWEANPDIPAIAPYYSEIFREMAAQGFNCVRLLFQWSKLEPVRGEYNQAYIDQLCGAIQDANKYGIYVMLDMHQDAFGKYIATPKEVICEQPNKGWDGAPDWATFTDGESTCTTDGSRESAPAVYHSWQNFWDNKEGIRSACIKSWQALIAQTAKFPNVLGYDLLNEPSLGYSSLADQNRKMYAYYGELIKEIRATEKSINAPERIIFFEPSVTFQGGPLPSVAGDQFTDDNNIVFAPHNYFGVFTTLLSIEQGFDLYNGLSKSYKTQTFIGEWGLFGNPADDVDRVKRFAVQEDKYFNGSTWWQWCQAPGDPHGISWDGKSYGQTSMHLVEVAADGSFTGNRNQIYLDVLRRARPIAIHGKPLRLTSNPDNGSMNLDANANAAGITELWIPNRFGTPTITGNNAKLKELKTVEGGFKAFVEVTGTYKITVSY